MNRTAAGNRGRRHGQICLKSPWVWEIPTAGLLRVLREYYGAFNICQTLCSKCYIHYSLVDSPIKLSTSISLGSKLVISGSFSILVPSVLRAWHPAIFDEWMILKNAYHYYTHLIAAGTESDHRAWMFSYYVAAMFSVVTGLAGPRRDLSQQDFQTQSAQEHFFQEVPRRYLRTACHKIMLA